MNCSDAIVDVPKGRMTMLAGRQSLHRRMDGLHGAPLVVIPTNRPREMKFTGDTERSHTGEQSAEV